MTKFNFYYLRSMISIACKSCVWSAISRYCASTFYYACCYHVISFYTSFYSQQCAARKQVRKVLWTRKAPACLLTVLIAYDKPRLCMNIHYCAPRLDLTGMLQCTLCCTHCAGTGSILVKVQCQVLNR